MSVPDPAATKWVPLWDTNPPAAGGGADANYVHTQSPLSASWVIVHNLGKRPSVSVVDSGDSVVLPNVHYDSDNQLTLTFGAATSGHAYLN